ncbi:farnesyltransferase geranylgeranyltransferase type-1 subunit alpha [Lecanosticta acicola]|uniref:Protein farnesyltransferase/geranylgeranyltransferase type-1 subunit alpha n=1 Tax=Lecanosticta acicola TaxID=111012 RepID=A0AAI9EAQ2_9PEZI|nr:farnesyltransferase geranylgeranyltransferase type-1 subunit alpha [Lecanosticta acicola]
MGKYSESPEWADVTPVPTDEGGPNPLAAIAYSDEYGETMSYLRALMAANEYSERALSLTEDLISMNPAHYTVWLYRAKTLFELNADLEQELEWLNEKALAHQKNYQIWHHRNLLIERIGKCDGEGEFVERMLELDSKNYHVWSYRQWLVRRFGLWEGEKGEELEFTERVLVRDVRNNSAWNHRWYIINGREGSPGVQDEKVRDREVDFATKAIAKAPQNPSPWTYLRGIFKKVGIPMTSLKVLAEEYADLSKVDDGGVRSSHALDLLADIWAEEKEAEKASEALDLLSKRYDPIRRNYWEFRKGLLGLERASAAA